MVATKRNANEEASHSSGACAPVQPGQSLWLGPLVMLLLVSAGIIPSLTASQYGRVTRLMGLSPGLPVRLQAFIVDKGIALKTLGTAPLGAGARLRFKATVSNFAFVTMVMAEGDGQPLVKTESARVDPGPGAILESRGRPYEYVVEGDESYIKTCALAGATEDEVAELIAEVEQNFVELLPSACVTIDVAGLP